MKYTNHSGGAKGSDTAWDFLGRKFGVTDHRHYWHPGLPKPHLGNVEISDEQLEEGWNHVLIANKTLKRKPDAYKSLLARNWFQVCNSEAVFAIGTVHGSEVEGGTGWAVQLGIDNNKLVYVFDQVIEKWFMWKKTMFIDCEIPTLTPNFAGVGTRKINHAGIKAVRDVYEKTLKSSEEQDTQ